MYGHAGRRGNVRRRYRRCALQRRNACRDPRCAADQHCGALSCARWHKTTSIHAQREALRRTGIYTGGMQRENVGASGNGQVRDSGLRSIVAADGHNLNRAGNGRGAGRGVSPASVDRAADAHGRTRRTLHLPNNILVTGSQHRCGEALHRQRGQRGAPGQHRHQHVIDHRDLRARAFRGIGRAHCGRAYRIR